MPRLTLPRVPSTLLSAYRDVGPELIASVVAASSTTEWYMYTTGAVAAGAANSGYGALFLDPAWWPDVVGKTPKVRVAAGFHTNTVAPGAGFQITVSLKPYGTTGGAAASDVRSTPDAAVASAVVAGAAASTAYSAVSADVAIVAGLYIVTMQANQAAAANSTAKLRVRLQQRWT